MIAFLCRSIPDRFAFEEALDYPRRPLPGTESSSQGGNEIGQVFGPLRIHGVAPRVLVQEFHRVRFRAVRGKKAEFHAGRAGRDPLRDNICPMRRVTVENKENLPLRVADHALGEIRKRFLPEVFLEDHELQVPVRGHGENSVRAEPLSRRRNVGVRPRRP